jgi:hypothetical protein
MQFGLARRDVDRCALRNKARCDHLANAAAPSGDERDAAIETE